MKTSTYSPESLRDMEYKDLKEVCGMIREKIIGYVSENGGYLASNLSNVEIAVALKRVFSDECSIVYAADDLDYAEKLMQGEDISSLHTGRKDILAEALGMSAAGELNGNMKPVVAVISSCDLLSSKGLEALQMIHASKNKVIIVFNDTRNGKTIKVLDKLISRLRNTKSYNTLKENVKDAIRPGKYGEQIIESIHDLKGKVRKTIVDEGIFSQYDIDYVGPINGHEPKELERAFQIAKEKECSTVVHCITVSGKGYDIAERDLNHRFDQIGKFNRQTGELLHSEHENYCYAARICSNIAKGLMEEDEKLCCVINDDQAGNGVTELFAAYPKRCFMSRTDISSTISFVLGILKEGNSVYLPVKASELNDAFPSLYRMEEYDRPTVISLIKDAEVDYGLLDQLQKMHICEPEDAGSILKAFQTAMDKKHPSMIIIPDECIDSTLPSKKEKKEREGWRKENVSDINEVALLAYGPKMNTIRSIIVNNSLPYDLYEMLYLNPIDEACLKEIFAQHRYVFICGNQYRNRILDYKDRHKINTETVFIENEDISELFRRIKEVLNA